MTKSMSRKKRKILREGRNCWRLAASPRVAFLIDGEAYFSALAAALEKARHSILIVGWDIDSRIRLRRDEEQSDLPRELGPFLNELAARRKELQIHVLDWDFAMLYALDREPLPLFKLGWRTHRRLHFALDDNHPLGASHHQKIVVVDDQAAFVGGLDLARGRWDTPAHDPHDDRRRDNGVSYPPFHDVQLLVDGEAARALGDLARERWRRATGEELSPPARGEDPWPSELKPNLTGVEIGIARTEPAQEGRPEVAEVRNLYLDAIAAARSTIYIENQYFSSAEVGEALAKRLAEENGPEVVLIQPRECSGWLEQGTMGVLRARLLRRLRSADRHGRLHVYYPHRHDLGKEWIQVHAKVLVVDDSLVRVGSSNLSNRSMGLDTECDLAIEAAGEEEKVRRAVRDFHHRLVAEHLGVSPERVQEAVTGTGSLGGAIEALRGFERTLEPLPGVVEPWLDDLVPEDRLLDPERPLRVEELVQELMPEELEEEKEGRLGGKGLPFLLLLLVALGLAAAWRWTSLGEWLDLQTLKGWGKILRESTAGPLLVTGVYLVGGLVLVPVTLLILVTALTFGPVSGFLIALAGCLASALSTYGLGRLLGREAVRKLAGGKLNRVSRWLARRGLWAVVAVRFLPVAPFTVVNLVSGASHIRFRDFALGTVLGMGPGILAITLFEKSLEQAVTDPEPMNFLILVGVVLGIAALAWGVRRWLSRRKKGPSGRSSPGAGAKGS